MNVVITGGSKGIGKAIAERFAADKHNLILCSRNAVELYKTMEELFVRFPGIEIKARPSDLGIKSEAQEFGKWVLEQVGKLPGAHLDILVNNVGQFVPGSIYNEEDGLLEKMMEANVYAAYHLTRMLLPKMMEDKKGHIFNLCSIASLQAYANGGAYSISKHALLGFSKNLREEMKPHGIKVTAVLPGAVYTDSWFGSGVSPERIMEAGDIAELIYAASKLSPQAVVEEITVRPQLGDL